MESTVQGLHLQREIVFVAENSREGLSSTSLDSDRPAGAVCRLIRLNDGFANFFDRTRAAVRRQIGSNEAARASGQVTLGAPRTTEENRLAILGIPGQGSAPRFALKKAKIFDQRSAGGSIKRAERWHPGGGNSVVDYLRERRVAASLCFRRCGNIRRTLTTAAVDAVTSCAPILEDLTSISYRALRLFRFGRTYGVFFGTNPIRGDCNQQSGYRSNNSAGNTADGLFVPA